MKKLIIINGTMGTGKSTVCIQLNKMLEHSVFLDGDWCWQMNPHVISEENKNMVIDNIIYLLNAFLKNQSFKYLIFCWVMHKEEILDEILSGLSSNEFELQKFTLTSSEDILRERLENDIQNGIRSEGIFEKSLARLAMYDQMDTIKIQNIELNTAVTTILNYINGVE